MFLKQKAFLRYFLLPAIAGGIYVFALAPDTYTSEAQVLVQPTLPTSLSGSGSSLTGMAQGVDRAAWRWAKHHGNPIVEARALWNRYGKAAGPIRNQWMSWYSTHLLAFWDGQSPGTRQMIDTARRDRLKVRVETW
ncbi:hypothetical protein ACSSZE_15475 [Acidithiobacillus caldus]